MVPRLGRIEAQKVDRLAQLGYGIRNCLARLGHTQGQQLGRVGLEQLRCPLQHDRPFGRRLGVPGRLRCDGQAECGIDLFGRRQHAHANDVTRIGRVQ